MRKIPPLSALRAFEAAARHMSFRAAAEELSLTPSAVSHQVRLLEQFLGRSLFRRRPRPLKLTEAGLAYFPAIRDGFDAFADAALLLTKGTGPQRLRVTTTNAFAARWLVPRLPQWRVAHPEIPLEVIGTDSVVDLAAGDADVAIRYAFASPPDLITSELLRDRFWPVASPRLLDSGTTLRRPLDLARYPLIHSWWGPNIHAPTWERWLVMAQRIEPELPIDLAANGLIFREELHAIDAVLAGQGISLLSDVLVGPELARGELVKVLDLALPGLGFYLGYRADNPYQGMITAFATWAVTAR